MSITYIKSAAQEYFEDYIRQQKCPFRVDKYTQPGGHVVEIMMPCDPDCVACFHETDFSNWTCLRLMQMRHEIPHPCPMGGVHIEEEEEDE